jgi:ABC-type sugar transport system ATPase subunit
VKRHGIEITGVSFSIGDFRMENMNLAVPEGEYLVLTGPNGAGKTVLTKLVCGLFSPLSGGISILGRDVTAEPPWKRRVGYVPQDTPLFPNRGVRGNIEFGLEVAGIGKKERRSDAAEIAGKLGIEGLLDRGVDGLSGGERQKVCLARALVLGPDILILDEPVSAIDEDSRSEICAFLKNEHGKTGVTTIHISHNSDETAMLADRVVRMESGKIL